MQEVDSSTTNTKEEKEVFDEVDDIKESAKKSKH